LVILDSAAYVDGKSVKCAVREYLRHKKSLCGQKNIASNSLADSQKIFLPPLPIKLGLKRKSIDAMNRIGEDFWYLTQNFP
jgi:hypothetical protein